MLVHNLITYTTIHTNHLKASKNTITMVKYPPKRLANQSNQRTIIHRHAQVKCRKNIQQQSSQKTEATKVNAIMEQLDKLDGNGHRHNTNINKLVPLFKSYN